MHRILELRRIVLVLTGLVFLVIATASSLAPQFMAEPLGYALDNPSALNEFRAIYVGLWLAHTVIFFWAAWRSDLLYLGDVAGILLLGQVVGRVFSLAVDGLPDLSILPPAAAELIGFVLIFAFRPGRSSSDSSPDEAQSRAA